MNYIEYMNQFTVSGEVKSKIFIKLNRQKEQTKIQDVGLVDSTPQKVNTFKLHPKRWISAFVSLILVICFIPTVYLLSKHNLGVDLESMAPSIYELYPNTGNFSFAKIKISSVYDDEYYDEGYTESGGLINYYLVMECVIEEDFYGVQESGTTIYIPVILSSSIITYHNGGDFKYADRYEESTHYAYYEKSELTEWLTGYDCILAYFRTHESVKLKVKDDPAEEIVTFYNMTDNCMPKYASIIPIKNNKVDLENRYYNKASGYTYEMHEDYINFITDGMSLDTVSENIRRLANGKTN